MEGKLRRQFEAIEDGVIDLGDVGERIRELKAQRQGSETTLANIQPSAPIPLRIYTDDSIAAFQQTVKQLFVGGQDRLLTKRCLKLFLEKVVIKPPRVELVGKPATIFDFHHR